MKIDKSEFIQDLDFGHYGTLNDYFVKACRFGDLDEIKRINEKWKPKLKNKSKFIRLAQYIIQRFINEPIFLDVHYYDDRCLRYTVDKGHLDVVKYLLTSDELVEKCDIHAEDDYALRVACSDGNLELVTYLLKSPDLKEHSNIHVRNDSPIINSYSNGHWDVVNFLVFEMNIPYTDHIKNFVVENNSYDLNTLFEKRDLNKELLTEIVAKPVEQKRKLKV